MNIELRPWEIADAPSLLKYANNWNIAQYMDDQFPHPYTLEHAHDFIDFARSHEPVHVYAIETLGEAVGGIGIHPQRGIYQKNAEMGYWLAEPFWGKGIMTAAIRHMIPKAFERFDVERIYARPFGTNYASQAVLEKNGFKLESVIPRGFYKRGQFHDELIYAIRKMHRVDPTFEGSEAGNPIL